MEAPPLLLERPPAAQLAVAIGGPVIAGVICGVVLGISGPVYTALTLVLVLGAIAGGYEHPDADEGAVRGLCSGAIFGTMILATNALIGAEPEAHLPDPPAFVVVVIAIVSMIAGAIGGALRKRHDRRHGGGDGGRAKAQTS